MGSPLKFKIQYPMYYISQPPGFSLEEHISNLELLYEACRKKNVESSTAADIWNQILDLREKLEKQKPSLSVNEE